MIFSKLRIAGLVVAVAFAAVAPPVDAARRSAAVRHAVGCRCAQCVAVAPVLAPPVYNAVPYAAATYNFVGAPVRMQAEQAYTMQNDPAWQQYQQFKAAQQAQAMFQQWAAQQLNAQPPAQGVPPAAAQGAPPVAPGVPPAEPLPPMGPAAPPATPNAAQPGQFPHAAAIPTIVEHCAKCHSGNEPKGDIWLDGQVDLRDPNQFESRDRIMQAMINLRMPKGHQLTGEQAGEIVNELYAE